ncbi:hypothetical protein B0G77_3466 [Paraburkholderia sp. BL10I2N1]|nr:hypothetical protein B0G77_3466 [Paraburkholderia sp. BL10I2N1]
MFRATIRCLVAMETLFPGECDFKGWDLPGGPSCSSAKCSGTMLARLVGIGYFRF